MGGRLRFLAGHRNGKGGRGGDWTPPPIHTGMDSGSGAGMTGWWLIGLFIAVSEAAGGAAGDVVGGLDEEGEGGEEVVVALGGVYEEVDGLVGPDYALCLGHLGPELGGLGGTVGLVGVEPAGVDGCEEVEAEL